MGDRSLVDSTAPYVMTRMHSPCASTHPLPCIGVWTQACVHEYCTCRLITLAKLAEMLNGVGDQSKLDPNRQPICLLLGGGMAAGKSTVRKIIGEAEFWTRVSVRALYTKSNI